MQNKTKLNVLQLTERYCRREAEYLCCDDVETQVAESQGNDAAGSSVSSIYSISVEMSFYSLYMYMDCHHRVDVFLYIATCIYRLRVK